MTRPYFLFLFFVLLLGASSCKRGSEDFTIRGWNILSDFTPTELQTLEASADYNINQLQLSHQICHNLKDIKNQWNRNIVNNLTRKAHDMGIPEVLVWDHALYDMDYYPDRFKINNSTQINLDNPNFWKWFKADYRKMLDKVPQIDGIVLTFIETGARVENQYSEILHSPEEKLAALVDSVASVVVNERNLKLYIRSFMYNRSELSNLMNCFDLIKTPEIVVMAKESPHDFFVTHPVAKWVKDIPFPVIIEFDCAHEFSGQGIVASIFPEVHFERWKYYRELPNVIGFSIRTDRYNNTSILGTPSEVNLYAIHKATENPELGIGEIIEDFIVEKFDSAAVSHLKPLFDIAPDIILSSFYTLGLNTTNHSRLDFDYRSIYTRHVSGRWLDSPEVYIGHNVDKTFHYWTDIVNHLSPARHKQPDETNLDELPEVFENNWLQPEELMDTVYLDYVMAEKEYGVQLAEKAMQIIKEAKPYCTNPSWFNVLYHTFNRTLMSAKLRKAYAQVYYAQRIWNRGEEFQSPRLQNLIQEGMEEMDEMNDQISDYREAGGAGQFDWKKDTLYAKKLEWEIQKARILTQKFE